MNYQKHLKLIRSLTTKQPHCNDFHLFNLNIPKSTLLFDLKFNILNYMLQGENRFKTLVQNVGVVH